VKQALLIAGLAVAGLAVGTAATFVHPTVGRVSGVPAPYGVVLGLLSLVALLVLAHVVVTTRLGMGIVAASWLAPLFVLSQERDAGDVVISNDALGWVFVLGSVIVAVVGVVAPTIRPSAAAPDEGAHSRTRRSIR
jgi:hypothetical protein